MSVSSLLRTAACVRSSVPSRLVRPAMASPLAASQKAGSMISRRALSATSVRLNEHGEESFEEFTARYENEFNAVQDVFELQRNLNNAFAYDLVPSPSVIVAALRAARRVDDFPTAVRIFEGIKAKVEHHGQYEEYLKELEPLREELGINLKESLYPDNA